ncbi:MAG: hypothetical protein VYA69_13785 [Gemmatimonadota bacterium]|nr:hypothetical protein [Gemmatimonadota bacterium]
MVRPIGDGGLAPPMPVYLRTGVYHQHESLVPDDAISGTAEFPVTPSANADNESKVSGGVPLTDWQGFGFLI